MAKKTFKERMSRVEEAAWVINEESKELKAMFAEIGEENVRLREEVRVLRLQVASLKRNNQRAPAYA